jgi:natural product precursor
MKKLRKLNLNSLVKNDLDKSKMSYLFGGDGCACGCAGGYGSQFACPLSIGALDGGGCQCRCAEPDCLASTFDTAS